MSLLQVSGIRKQIGKEQVLQGVSFTQEPFKNVAIAGESGSGKSTLLKIISGFVQPDAGEVLYKGIPVLGPNDRLIPGHPHIAYLSQHFELRNSYRVEEVLQYANLLSDQEAAGLYEICRIGHLLKRKTNQVSGGERQRIALCRLLIGRPRLLLLDEPFSNLDPGLKNSLKEVIKELGDRLKISCILVSHDPPDTLPWANAILVMQGGQIIQRGTPEEVYRRPVSEYAAGLFGKYNLLGPPGGGDLLRLFGADKDPAGADDDPGAAGSNIYKDYREKYILIRPESFKFVAAGGGAAGNGSADVAAGAGSVSGTVSAVNFLGSSYETTVQLANFNMTVIVRTMSPGPVTGETAYLSVSPGDFWAI